MRPYEAPEFATIINESRRRAEAKHAVAELGFGRPLAIAMACFLGAVILCAVVGIAFTSAFKVWTTIGVTVCLISLLSRVNPVGGPLNVSKEAVRLFGIANVITPKDKVGAPPPAQAVGPVSPAARAKSKTPAQATVPKTPATPASTAQRRASSPSRRWTPRERIADESKLSRFLSAFTSSPSSAAAANGTPVRANGGARPLTSPSYGYGSLASLGTPLGSPNAESAVYRPSPPASPSPTKPHAAEKGPEGQKVVERSGPELLAELGISADAVDRLRHFLCSRIIKLFVESYDRNAAALARAAAAAGPAAAAPFASPFGSFAGFATPSPAKPAPVIAGPGASAIIAAAQAQTASPTTPSPAKAGCTVAEYVARFPTDPAVQERGRLERYLTVPGRTQPEYVLHRLREFARDSSSCLYGWKWNGGIGWKNREWLPDLPTDAEIMLALLCACLDLSYEGRGLPAGEANFSGRHVAWMGEDAAKKRSPIVLFMVRPHPPHFKVSAYGEIYDPGAGRANFFESFLILLYLLKTKYPAQLGPLAAVDRDIGLLTIV